MVDVRTKECAVTECQRPLIARGLCTLHYQRVRAHGTTEKSVRRRMTAAELPHGTLQGYNFHGCRCNECKRVQRQYQAAWREQMSERCKEYQLRHEYGMTKAEYDARLEAQSGVCALCREVRLPRGRKFMDVDHDHRTGAVRGILCSDCNKNVGRMEQRIARWPGMLEYLGWQRA